MDGYNAGREAGLREGFGGASPRAGVPSSPTSPSHAAFARIRGDSVMSPRGSHMALAAQYGSSGNLRATRATFTSSPAKKQDPAVAASLRRRAARDGFTPTEVAVEVLSDIFQGRDGYIQSNDLPTILDKLLPEDVGEAEVEWVSLLAESVTGEVQRQDISFALLSWYGYRTIVRNFVHLFTRFDVKASNTFSDEDAEAIMLELSGGVPVSPVEARRVVDLADQLDRGTVRRFDIMASVGTWYMDVDAAPLKASVALQAGLRFAGSQVRKVVDHYARVLWMISAAQVLAAVAMCMRPCGSQTYLQGLFHDPVHLHLTAMLVVQAAIAVAQTHAPSLALAALPVGLLAIRSAVDRSSRTECGLVLIGVVVVLVLSPLPFLFSRIVLFLRLTVAYLSAVRDLQMDCAGMPNNSRLRATGVSLEDSASVVSILRTPEMSPKMRPAPRYPLSPSGQDLPSQAAYRLLDNSPMASASGAARGPDQQV
jgi:hypothetical protein